LFRRENRKIRYFFKKSLKKSDFYPMIIEKIKKKERRNMEKEYLYIGHYVDTNGNYILKVGTTNNLDRRKREHTTNYRRTKNYTMPKDEVFNYDWFLKLSKYNTLRYEDKTRQKFIKENIGDFVRNDRFCCSAKPPKVVVKIRKEYEVTL
jgi:hypothetical protein